MGKPAKKIKKLETKVKKLKEKVKGAAATVLATGQVVSNLGKGNGEPRNTTS